MFVLILLFILVSVFIYIYHKTKSIYKYWEKKGAYYVKPAYFFGNIADVFFRRRTLSDVVSELYYSNKNARYIGVYQLFTPTLLVKDLELVKQIMTKHFDSFADHYLHGSEEADPMWAKSLLIRTKKTDWQETRSKVTPIFTRKKLRHMIPLIQECSQKLIQHLKLLKQDVDVDINRMFKKIQNDIIATVAFDVQVNTFKDENNEFFKVASEAADFSGLRAFMLYGYALFPEFMKFFKIKMFSEKVSMFFRSIIEESIKTRVQEKTHRPDFLHLLATAENILNNNNAEKTNLKTKIGDITSQCIFFFFAGFESIPSVMTYCAYELAINSEIQEKLYQEVVESIGNKNGSLTYDAIVNMKYLDNVVSEVFRMYIPTVCLDRKCTKPFTIEPQTPDERPLHIDEDTCIWIPMRNFHRDPKYFKNPDKFDPERFNRDNILDCTFIPFGNGPRKCIGDRFTLLEMKLVIVEMLRSYKFAPSEKTEVPLSFDMNNFLLKPKNKILLKLIPRTQ